MRNYDEREEQAQVENIFEIPVNHNNLGRFFNGKFELRNIVEAIIFAGLPASIVLFFDFSIDFKAFLTIFIVLPLLFASLNGVNGLPFSEFLLVFRKYLKNRRKMRYQRINDPKDRIILEEKKKEDESKVKKKEKKGVLRIGGLGK